MKPIKAEIHCVLIALVGIVAERELQETHINCGSLSQPSPGWFLLASLKAALQAQLLVPNIVAAFGE